MKSDFHEMLEGKVKLADSVWIAPGAQLVGDITLESNSSVWFNAVLRADYSTITVGEGSNIQDGCILHVDPGVPLHIGKNCVLGHAAIAHGCSIGDESLIGMRATIMNHAKIGNHCIIGAHALITEGKVIPDYSLVMGSPGKIIRELNPTEVGAVKENALRYQKLAAKYLGSAV